MLDFSIILMFIIFLILILIIVFIVNISINNKEIPNEIKLYTGGSFIDRFGNSIPHPPVSPNHCDINTLYHQIVSCSNLDELLSISGEFQRFSTCFNEFDNYYMIPDGVSYILIYIWCIHSILLLCYDLSNRMIHIECVGYKYFLKYITTEMPNTIDINTNLQISTKQILYIYIFVYFIQDKYSLNLTSSEREWIYKIIQFYFDTKYQSAYEYYLFQLNYENFIRLIDDNRSEAAANAYKFYLEESGYLDELNHIRQLENITQIEEGIQHIGVISEHFEVGDIVELIPNSPYNRQLLLYAKKILDILQYSENKLQISSDYDNYRDKFLNNLALIIIDTIHNRIGEIITYKCILLYPQLFNAVKTYQENKNRLKSKQGYKGGLDINSIQQRIAPTLGSKFENIKNFNESSKGVINALEVLKREYIALEDVFIELKVFEIPITEVTNWHPMLIKSVITELYDEDNISERNTKYAHLQKFLINAHGMTDDNNNISIPLRENEYVVMLCNPFIPSSHSREIDIIVIDTLLYKCTNFSDQLELLSQIINKNNNQIVGRNMMGAINNFCVFSQKCPNLVLDFYEPINEEIGDTQVDNIYYNTSFKAVEFPIRCKSKTIAELIDRSKNSRYPLETYDNSSADVNSANFLDYLYGCSITQMILDKNKILLNEKLSESIQIKYIQNEIQFQNYLKHSDELDSYYSHFTTSYTPSNDISTLLDEINSIRKYQKAKELPNGFILFVFSCRT